MTSHCFGNIFTKVGHEKVCTPKRTLKEIKRNRKPNRTKQNNKKQKGPKKNQKESKEP